MAKIHRGKETEFVPVTLVLESNEELQTLYLKLLPDFKSLDDMPAGEDPGTEAVRLNWDFERIKASDADYRLWKLVRDAIYPD